jgi:hypothetical protein
VLLDLKVISALQALVEEKARLVPLVQQACKAIKDLTVQLDSMVLLDSRDLMEPLVLMEQLDHKAMSEQLVLMEQLVRQVFKAKLELQVLVDL